MSRVARFIAPVLLLQACVAQDNWTTVAPERVTLVPRDMAVDALDFSTGLRPLGSVPYDNRSLPLVSPDGDLVITQVGAPPEWATMLAEDGAPLPADNRLEIHQIDRRLGEANRIWVSESSLLLGRPALSDRLLVESPRRDGSRWIGRLAWHGGDIEWVADDDQVNAFATQGPDGRLAWSRRAQGAAHFDLVIRRAGEEWTVSAQGGDWLMPTWNGDGLFALRLVKGRLDATYMNAETPESTSADVVRLPIADGVTRFEAYQCMAAQAPVAVAIDEAVLLFWHPTSRRIAMWRPVTSPGAATLLAPGSIAAVLDASGHALVATETHLALQDLANAGAQRVLLVGTHVPRTVTNPTWPYLLLSPMKDRIALSAFKLLTEEEKN